MKELLTKYQIFKKLPQISHIHKKSYLSKYHLKKRDHLFLPYKFYGRKSTFSFLPVVSQ